MSTSLKQLRWAAYDTEWSKDADVPSAYSAFAPAIEAYKGLLYCLHQDTANNTGLWWNIYDKETGQWRGEAGAYDPNGKRLRTYGAPAVTHANDYLYCVNHVSNADPGLWWSRYNTEVSGTRWSEQKLVVDPDGRDVRTAVSPAVTVYDGLLYCVHEKTGRLHWLTHDTARQAWSSDEPVPGDVPVTRAPAVDRFKDLLHCVHDRGGDELYWITYDSKTQQWSDDRLMVDEDGKPVLTPYAPAVARYNDYLYCVYCTDEASEFGSGLWWTRRYDVGGPWSRPQRIPYVVSSPGADITAYHGPLYCVHRG
ncbi:hypothetical protein AB0E96_19215 [Kitasatospora sp. NPDC036755]|uniref:hypothetical protein n=1 Tax=Kitasatospora sp. NPDC036755 TaxID=3154600 RepID=UPI0033D14777